MPEAQTIKPSIGRRVWYWPSAHDKHGAGRHDSITAEDSKQPLDAGVAYVHNDRLINISVADQLGKMHHRTSVTLYQPGDTITQEGGYCTWMDYQINAAAREATATAEAQATSTTAEAAKPLSDAAIEQEILAKGLTAPRVTPTDLDAVIADTEIVKHVSKSGKVLRWAVITAKNGFAVAGKPSCAVSVANDNAELGEKMAIDNARNELWPLLGYELSTFLAERANVQPKAEPLQHTEGPDDYQG